MGFFNWLFGKNDLPKVPENAAAPTEEEISDVVVEEFMGKETGIHCELCGVMLYDQDKIRELAGNKVHRRCLKKAKKKVMRGENIETLKISPAG